jgi:hypothetical protein
MKKVVIGCACILVAATAWAGTVTVGGTSSYAEYPFRGCSGVNEVRSQGLVLASDGVPAGSITKWEWYAYTGASGYYINFYLRCCHTGLAALTDNFAANYDGNSPVQVYFADAQYVPATPDTWFSFIFTHPFNYNGSSNLIMEVAWTGRTGGHCDCYANTASSRFAYAANGGNVAVTNHFHYQRITIGGVGVAPTSLGRVKSLYR